MKTARIMDQPEDYEKLHINPDHIEKWEDGRRNHDDSSGNWEWWYFDSILDDGSKAVIQFFTKAGMKNIQKDGDVPSVTIKYTLPDGTLLQDEVLPDLNECSFGTDKCNVHLGSCSFVGDFKTYTIQVEGKKLGCNLTLVSHAKPYRPGTAYFEFGDDEYYTWLCSVPQGEVTGTLTYEDKTVKVQGSGYHDHQWGNRFYLPEWNNWLWARQSFGDYSALIFDFVTSEESGFARIPVFFVQNADGELVFESYDSVTCTVPEMTPVDKASGKEYPKIVCYEFDDGNAHVSYRLESKEILESQGFKSKPVIGKIIVKKLGMNLSYMRFLGDGSMTLTKDGETIQRSGELIYEFMYPGDNCREHMVNA